MSRENTFYTNHSNKRKATRSWPVIYDSDSQNWRKSPQYDIPTDTSYTSTFENTNQKYHHNFLIGSDGIDFYYGDPNQLDTNHNPVSNTSTMNNSNSGIQAPIQTQLPHYSCNASPNPVAILFLTLLMTSSATALLCAAIMTNYWEYVRWDVTALEKLVNKSQHINKIEWMLDGRVARIPIAQTTERHHVHKDIHPNHNRAGVFLVPMYGGIWTMCIELTDDEIRKISSNGFPSAVTCWKYLANPEVVQPEIKDWQHMEVQTPLHPQISKIFLFLALVQLLLLFEIK